MNRRRLLLGIGLPALAAVVAYLALWLTAPRQGITRANFEKLSEGMSKKEVETILGAPPGNYSKHGDPSFRKPPVYWWLVDDLAIYAEFSAENRLIWKEATGFEGQESFLTKLRRWLGIK